MKRLTAEQVAKNFEATAIGMSLIDMNNAAGIYRDAAKFVRDNLVPRWQDEPDADGWHWVEGIYLPMWVWYLGEGDWIASPNTDACDDGSSLNNRRVCPIGERPEDGA